VHVISKKVLLAAAQRFPESASGVRAWLRVAERSEWYCLEDVRQTYPNADGVNVSGKTLTVFNIGGNKFRLIVKIEYAFQKIFIKHLLTHAEYDQERWKK
jgi:mRNA interferase HigB